MFARTVLRCVTCCSYIINVDTLSVYYVTLCCSYIISVGVVDKLSVYFDSVRGPLPSNSDAAEFVQHGLSLLVALTKLLAKR